MPVSSTRWMSCQYWLQRRSVTCHQKIGKACLSDVEDRVTQDTHSIQWTEGKRGEVVREEKNSNGDTTTILISTTRGARQEQIGKVWTTVTWKSSFLPYTLNV